VTPLKSGPEILETRKSSIHPALGQSALGPLSLFQLISRHRPSRRVRRLKSTLPQSLRKAKKAFSSHLTSLKKFQECIGSEFPREFRAFGIL
jgi:hypothetical protein